MKTNFRVSPLGAVIHNNKTKEILSKIRGWQQSQFIRNAIIEYAIRQGYKNDEHTQKPDFISIENWDEFLSLNKRSNTVDYNFLLAFYWLKSRPTLQYIQNSTLLRNIIAESEHLVDQYSYASDPEI